ncbi:uncharacterized protein BX663DRAFT_489888 [Cokeromyces recurvatus]|uniref:uncharacterized protein n=1 Tax=Cokeromyces recurvatus TaxID=90255 RepID=UPI0022205CF4|nr:uncharacterized protein BX663DRAFT_489888 [Cokeromyces recurvatus]KAI7898620.1 hypothetical protein BX663DRAFT_489888 [Cokeromyces recurvatus]
MYRFPTSGNNITLATSKKNSKLTIEPVTFNNVTEGDYFSLNNKNKNNSSGHRSQKRRDYPTTISTPTELFAKNLYEAVLDIDDSYDCGYVYNTNESPSFSLIILKEDSTMSLEKLNKSIYYKRPVLRSTVSELLPSRNDSYFYNNNTSSISNQFHYQRQEPFQSSDDDHEHSPLLFYNKTTIKKRKNRNKWIITILSLFVTFTIVYFTFLIFPLRSIEVISFGNVLSTQKQLFLNIFVQARNRNGFKVQISHGSIDLFATIEFLGTIETLEVPLIFEPSSTFFYFNSSSKKSIATSQIQLKYPGKTKAGDIDGNERWSSLIRYPYELTIRGVLKYQLFPVIGTQVYSVRICKMMQVDPATGIVRKIASDKENSICNER